MRVSRGRFRARRRGDRVGSCTGADHDTSALRKAAACTATTRFPRASKTRLVPNVNGLTVNMLEAGTQGRPLGHLVDGFPNLAYSWRKVMPAIADAGYYVIAPDCRGYGRTVGWDRSFDADPTPVLTLNMVRDQIALVYALGYRKAELIVGHDQGQLMAPNAAIVRPAHVSPPDDGVGGEGAAPPSFPFAGTERKPAYTAAELDAEFAKLNPPRRDYQGGPGEQAGR